MLKVIILILAILLALVIAGGVLTLSKVKGLDKKIYLESGECLDEIKKVKKQNIWVGSSLIVIGVVGLLLIY